MVDNWTGCDNHRRGSCEEWFLAFLLWGCHAEGVEGEVHRNCPLGWSDSGDRSQVPTERVDHPNGVAEVAYLIVLIPQEGLGEFERQLTSVIGFAPEVGPDGTRTWSLSVTTRSHSPRLMLRTPRDREEEMYVKKKKGSIYKVAFQLKQLEGEPGGGLLSI